jgi:hypothetical protein
MSMYGNSSKDDFEEIGYDKGYKKGFADGLASKSVDSDVCEDCGGGGI